MASLAADIWLKTSQGNDSSRRSALPRATGNRRGTSPSGTGAGRAGNRISVDSILQNSSDIPSAQPRFPPGARPRRQSIAGLPNLASRVTGVQNVPSRTTKISEKLVIIPTAQGDEEEEAIAARDQEAFEERFQLAQPSDYSPGSLWRDVSRRNRDDLARVTAYCTAQSMRMKATAEFLKKTHGARTKLYDDCLYVVYHMPLQAGDDGYRVKSRPMLMQPGSKKSILDLMIERGERHDHYESDLELYATSPEFNRNSMDTIQSPVQVEHPSDVQKRAITNPLMPHAEEFAELFVFSYGVVVFWNFTEHQERDILADLTFAESEDEKAVAAAHDKSAGGTSSLNRGRGAHLRSVQATEPLSQTTTKYYKASSLMTRPLFDEEVETEEFHFQYSEDVKKPRVFNDMFTLMPKSDHMVKLTISHAVAQSTKLCYFEERMNETMEACQNVPKVLARTGELKMTRTDVLRMMGRLYKNRVDINLSSNVLDVPNFFWNSEPVLQPLYGAIRDYLEIDSRIEKINGKSEVFLDLATMLSDSVADSKMSHITIIIIWLILISLVLTITELTMRFEILQRKKGNAGNDMVCGDASIDVVGIPGLGGHELVKMAATEESRPSSKRTPDHLDSTRLALVGMTPDEREWWAGNLTLSEKESLCGQDILCQTFAKI